MSNEEVLEKNGQGYLGLSNFNIGNGFSEELAGLNSDFDRIKIAAGGGTTFEVPGDHPNEPDTVKEFSAVIVYHHPMYTFYKTKYTGSNTPPDCFSTDGTVGIGTPGGACLMCLNNKFGSGENGSKACKNKHQIYLLREDEIFPIILSLPTSSNKELSRYIKRLLSRGQRSDSVVTKLSLKKAVNKNGIPYSQVQFSVDRVLTDEEIPLIKNVSDQIKLYTQSVQAPQENQYVNPFNGEGISTLCEEVSR